nr:hypothetical protein [uncultured Mucilaginibacter sp.]
METEKGAPQLSAEKMYYYANEMFDSGSTTEEVRLSLIARGADEQQANELADLMGQQVTDARRAKAKNDMIYGALWFAGGLILTLAHVGFIFWGAMLFGGIQFFKGVINWNE